MNYTIKRLEEVRKQIKGLQKIQEQGGFMLSGLTIDLTVGAKSKDDKEMIVQGVQNIELGIYSGKEAGIVQILIEGLQNTEKVLFQNLQREVQEAQNYIRHYFELYPEAKDGN